MKSLMMMYNLLGTTIENTFAAPYNITVNTQLCKFSSNGVNLFGIYSTRYIYSQHYRFTVVWLALSVSITSCFQYFSQFFISYSTISTFTQSRQVLLGHTLAFLHVVSMYITFTGSSRIIFFKCPSICFVFCAHIFVLSTSTLFFIK